VVVSAGLTLPVDLLDFEDLADRSGSVDLKVHLPTACQVDSLDWTQCEGWQPDLEELDVTQPQVV
jgi:hypothetical protein